MTTADRPPTTRVVSGSNLDAPVPGESRAHDFARNIPNGRLRCMLEYIPRWPRSTTADALARHLAACGFEVGLRTVQRDLAGVQSGLPEFGLSCHEEGKDSRRWFIAEDAPVHFTPSLDDHAALTFLFAASHLGHLLPSGTVAALKPFQAQALRHLSERGTVPAAAWDRRIHVFPAGLQRIPPAIDAGVRDMVYSSVFDRKVIDIDYVSRGSGTIRKHRVSPLGLVVRDRVIYLVAASHRREGAPLQFALHRIRAIAVAGDAEFVHPPNFDLAEYAAREIGFHYDGSSELRLRVRVGRQAFIGLSECPLEGQLTLVPDVDAPESGGGTLTADVPNSFELRQWLRSLGPDGEVLEPGFLRHEIAQEVLGMARRYGLVPAAAQSDAEPESSR